MGHAALGSLLEERELDAVGTGRHAVHRLEKNLHRELEVRSDVILGLVVSLEQTLPRLVVLTYNQ